MKKSRYNCTWQPMTPENTDGYIVNRHVYTRELRAKQKEIIPFNLNNFSEYPYLKKDNLLTKIIKYIKNICKIN